MIRIAAIALIAMLAPACAHTGMSVAEFDRVNAGHVTYVRYQPTAYEQAEQARRDATRRTLIAGAVVLGAATMMAPRPASAPTPVTTQCTRSFNGWTCTSN